MLSIVFILVPLILAAILHMLVVKKDLFQFLTIPISVNYFGQNKTWRGFAIMPLLNSVFTLLLNIFIQFTTAQHAILYGICFGLAYVLAELPNSFIKRKKGIKSGEEAHKNKYLFMIFDKLDSAMGVAIMAYFILEITLIQSIMLFIISSITHAFFSILLVFLKVKKRF